LQPARLSCRCSRTRYHLLCRPRGPHDQALSDDDIGHLRRGGGRRPLRLASLESRSGEIGTAEIGVAIGTATRLLLSHSGGARAETSGGCYDAKSETISRQHDCSLPSAGGQSRPQRVPRCRQSARGQDENGGKFMASLNPFDGPSRVHLRVAGEPSRACVRASDISPGRKTHPSWRQ